MLTSTVVYAIKIRLHSQNTDIKPKKEQNYVCGCRPIPIHALPKIKWGFPQSVLTDWYRTQDNIWNTFALGSASLLFQNSDSEEYKGKEHICFDRALAEFGQREI